MGLLRRPLSIRAGVVLQLALVATASLTLLAVFALKVIEVTMQRRTWRPASPSPGSSEARWKRRWRRTLRPEPHRRDEARGPFPLHQ